TAIVPSSRKSTPCGKDSAGDEISKPPVNDTSGDPADLPTSTSRIAMLLRLKAAIASRRLFGEKRTSSVRPREEIMARTRSVARYSIFTLMLVCFITGAILGRAGVATNSLVGA